VPSAIYQYVINLIVCLNIKRRPGLFMDVLVWKHRFVRNYIFLLAKLTILTSLSLLS